LHAGVRLPQVARRLASRADRRQIELLVRRFISQRFQRRRAPEAALWDGPGQQTSVEEISPGKSIVGHQLPLCNARADFAAARLLVLVSLKPQNSKRAPKAGMRAGSVLLKTPAPRLFWTPLLSNCRPPTPLNWG